MLVKQLTQIVLILMATIVATNMTLAQAKSVLKEVDKPSISIDDLRARYLKAELGKWNVNWSSYQQTLDDLEGYPLLPYFEQSQLMKNFALKNESKISDFLDKYQGTPLDGPLRRKWLSHLSRYKYKSRYLQYFKAPMNSKYTCLYHQYQLDQGIALEEVLPQVTKLWLVGESQPKECDGLFKLWQKHGYQSNELIWQRVMLAQKKRQYILVKYLLKQLPKEEQYLVKLWKEIKAKPKLVQHLDKFKRGSKQETRIIIDGINRLTWQDELLALDVYQQAKQQGRFSPLQQELVLKPLITAISRSDNEKAQSWYNALDEDLIHSGAMQWRMARELRNVNYQGVKNQYQLLNAKLQQTRQWQYWYARTLQLTNKSSEALKIYQELAKQRSYYGFLAAARIGDEAVINHQALVFTDEQKQDLLKHSAWQRALELYKLNRLTAARREWNYWMSQLTTEESLIAAKLAYQQGWFDRGIYTLSQIGAINDMDIRFPMPYNDQFSQFAKQYSINVAWAYAIARKESLFMSDASSSVGALGIMQVKPITAGYINKTKLNRWQILDVDTNVKLGINYLSYLMDKFDNNIVLATAAYNAGPGKVERWLKAEPNLAADAWIETIPYKETREYVKSVLAYTEIYQQKIGQRASPFKTLIQLQID
ncbi:transglycosylase SLT domain-containing protein [Thalassomonas sp. M1454]|uniref:transglycosylase SLT domain-containing protein n=1 Tax=Thalassomonas sp. M1454 TaxID=2594477 RepID=UPI00117DFF40|nr:transglycosylase SLT domain-containing protein [Thalassomonas sp. M1454]TRX58144.1 lytic murein transglycosylase [Thalassomonas sp. M1454]